MISIKNLNVHVNGKKILNNLSIDFELGKVHAIMGPNGSGKSTFANVLSGHKNYEVESGSVLIDGKDFLQLEPHERSLAGLFHSFQYPISIPGISNIRFLQSIINQHREHQGLDAMDAYDLMKQVKECSIKVGLDDGFLQRGLNEGFSGGEKKRNEILQMMLLQPRFILLDEVDSGLDIDALKRLSECINQMRDANRIIILVTHYQRLLDHIHPDHVHIFTNGSCVKSGDSDLAKKLEDRGYSWLSQSEKV